MRPFFVSIIVIKLSSFHCLGTYAFECNGKSSKSNFAPPRDKSGNAITSSLRANANDDYPFNCLYDVNGHRSRRAIFGEAAIILILCVATTPLKSIAEDFAVASPFDGDCSDLVLTTDKQTYDYIVTGFGPKNNPGGRRCAIVSHVKDGTENGAFRGASLSKNDRNVNNNIQGGAKEPGIKWSTQSNDNEIQRNNGEAWINMPSFSVANKDDSFDISGDKFGQLFMVSYTGFSLLAGLKELITRFQNRGNSNK